MLSALMLGSCLAGCGAQQEAKTPDAPAEADLVTEAAVSLLGSHSDTAGKEETVYVIADADGSPMPEWKPLTADAPWSMLWGDTVEIRTDGPSELQDLLVETYRKGLPREG